MLELKDFSDVMQRIISTGATFMISQSGIPGNYSICAAYHDGKDNKSARITFREEDGVAVQPADLEHPVIEFNDVDSVVAYMCKEVGAARCWNSF